MQTAKHSRRAFLGAAALGSTAIGLATSQAVALLSRDAQRLPEEEASSGDLTLPLVAYVRDAGTGELVLLTGTKEIVHRDGRLVSRLVAMAKEGERDVVAS